MSCVSEVIVPQPLLFDQVRCGEEAYAVVHYENMNVSKPVLAGNAAWSKPVIALATLIQSMAESGSSRPLLILVVPQGEQRYHDMQVVEVVRYCAFLTAAAKTTFRCIPVLTTALAPPVFNMTEGQRFQVSRKAGRIGPAFAKLRALKLNCGTVILLDTDQILAGNIDDIFYRAAHEHHHVGSYGYGFNINSLRTAGGHSRLFEKLLQTCYGPQAQHNLHHLMWHAPDQDMMTKTFPSRWQMEPRYSAHEFLCRRWGTKLPLAELKVLHFLGSAKPEKLVDPSTFVQTCAHTGSHVACSATIQRMVAERCWRPTDKMKTLEKRWLKSEKRAPNASFVREAYKCCGHFYAAWLRQYALMRHMATHAEQCIAEGTRAIEADANLLLQEQGPYRGLEAQLTQVALDDAMNGREQGIGW